MQPDSLIAGTDLGVSIRGRQLLRHIDFEIARGQILTVIGPNGAGKTTLVRLALGLLAPTEGRIRRRAGLRLGYMPQRLHIPESMPLSVSRFLRLTNCSIGLMTEKARLVGVDHLLDRPIQRLSGGETQRVLLTRALLSQPDLLVLDEPVQGIDVNGQVELYRLIRQIRDQQSCAVMMVSHDLHLVMAATDRVLCINQHVCCSGHPDAVSRHPAYLDLFGATDNATLAVYAHHHDHRHDLHGDIVEPRKTPPHG